MWSEKEYDEARKVYSCFSYSSLRALHTMRDRSFRSRYIKDGGTSIHHTGHDNLYPHNSPQYPFLGNNPYQILATPFRHLTTLLPDKENYSHNSSYHRSTVSHRQLAKTINKIPNCPPHKFILIKKTPSRINKTQYCKYLLNKKHNAQYVPHNKNTSIKGTDISSCAKNTFQAPPKNNFQQNSLFTSQTYRDRSRHSKMATSTQASAIGHDTPTGISNTVSSSTPKDITIDMNTPISAIKSIPVTRTWQTYISNHHSPTLNENDWSLLSDHDKYHHLIMLRSDDACIHSPFTTFVITPDTDEKVIRKIPKKDCRLLLKAYADSQGYPHLASTIETMLVEPMRDELIQAQAKLSMRTPQNHHDDIKKPRTDEIPFVLTHATTDEDIIASSETSLMHELQSMFKDRNMFDSIEWESLELSDLRDMARIERNEMLKCFSCDDTGKNDDDQQIAKQDDKDPNGNPYVYVEEDDDEDDSISEQDTDGDVTMDDAQEEHVNESDSFISRQLSNKQSGYKQSDKKMFRFSFSRETTDDEIYQLNHKRASRIAKQHAIMIEHPLSDEFFNEATTEQFYDYLIQERNEFRLEYDYEQFRFSGQTTDTSIKKLPRDKLEAFICYCYRDTDRLLSDDFFKSKTDMELKYLLITERDNMRSKDNQTSSQPINNPDPKPPNTLPKGLRAKRQNLNGWNIDNALSTTNNNLHSRVFHPKSSDSNDPKVIPMSTQYFFIRANIATEGNGTHTPSIVRRFFKALRNSDPTIQLQPFDRDDTDLNNILDTESLIPNDATSLLTWVRGLYSTAKRLHFSIRVSHTCPLRELRTDIFGWCKTNRCYIDMDYINSEKLFSYGWICGLHPRLYNRNDLKSWIDSFDESGAIGQKIKMYPRTIFTVDDDGKKTITNAIIIDGAIEDAKTIMTFLYSKIKWSDRYPGATFVPFRTSATLTKADQRTAMEYHNNYLHSTYRKLVRVANPTTNYELEDGEVTTFRDWLIQSKLHGANMIKGVETMKDDIVRIIYNKKHQAGVDFIMSTLQENVIEAFGKTIADEMLGPNFDIVTPLDSEMEDVHVQQIKSVWQGQTITNSNPPNNLTKSSLVPTTAKNYISQEIRNHIVR